MGFRRKARVAALQVLYELAFSAHDPAESLARLAEERALPPEACDFSSELIQGVLGSKSKLDGFIERFAPAFPVEQMAIVDRTILRLAIFEILFRASTPVKVTINEAVELAKVYGGDSSPRLVNGVLGSIVAKQETNKIDGTKHDGVP